MPEPIILAILTLLGGGTFGGIVAAFFARRKTAAEADLTVGGAWEKFVQQQDRALEALKADTNRLRGELDAARKRVSVLERQQHEALFFQAMIIARSQRIDKLLERNGIDVPESIPTPPVMREPNTRADD